MSLTSIPPLPRPHRPQQFRDLCRDFLGIKQMLQQSWAFKSHLVGAVEANTPGPSPPVPFPPSCRQMFSQRRCHDGAQQRGARPLPIFLPGYCMISGALCMALVQTACQQRPAQRTGEASSQIPHLPAQSIPHFSTPSHNRRSCSQRGATARHGCPLRLTGITYRSCWTQSENMPQQPPVTCACATHCMADWHAHPDPSCPFQRLSQDLLSEEMHT